jgi:serine phosphatase RsbU (regulator of sigma subunit)
MDTVTGTKITAGRPSMHLSAQQMARWIIIGASILAALSISAVCVMDALTWIDKPFAGFLINQRMVVGNIAQQHWTGIEAGLKFPDKILSANDRILYSVKDLEELIKRTNTGDPLRYVIDRDGKIIEVTVSTMRFTLIDLLRTFGIPFISGIIYVLLGLIVFIMKPNEKDSSAFILACFFLGIYFLTTFDLLSNHLMFIRVYIFAHTFFPAAAVHLSMVFPEKRTWIEKRPYLQWIPYLISSILIIPLELFYPEPLFVKIYYNTVPIYMAASAVSILFSTLQAYFKRSSMLARLRARVVLAGAVLAFPIPVVGNLLSLFGGALQDNLTTIPMLIFPASIAYAIAKHDLFAIDLIVRRTAGYVLSTATIVGAYALLVTVLNVIFQSSETARSPLFSLAFALTVVFLFEPLHKRIQGFVDRVFYRQHYDYRKTIRDISEAMISILDQEVIVRTLISTVVHEMFLENGVLLLADASGKTYQVRVVEGVDADSLGAKQLGEDDPLVQAFEAQNDAMLRYDIDLQPRYGPHREALRQTFQALASELILPMKYKDAICGIICLGRKKSGKMFTPEDLDLLKTIINQSAVALENARLFAENIEKSRMEEELKIAHDIQISMLPDKPPQIEGFTIAARSIPAREVGGDFYDFIDMRNNGSGESLALVIGDVSGKAVSGALVMAASRSIFRVLAEAHTSVEQVMSIGNARLNRDIKKGMFVALLYAVLDPRRRTLTLSNAGQTQPIICPAEKSTPVYIDTTGDKFPLGILRKCRYEETQVSLKRGDSLVFYTDGVVEAMNDKEELYGFERFMASIEAGRELGANDLLEKLMEDVSRYVGAAEPHDDLTLVVVKVE